MSSNAKDIFGKVFVRVDGTYDKSNYGSYKLLENAQFSNLNLKVHLYCCAPSDLNGKKYFLGILGHQLKAPIELGQSEIVDTDLFDAAYQGHVQTMKQIGLTDESDKTRFAAVCGDLLENRFHINSVLGSTGMYPNEMEIMNKLLVFTYVDDLLESASDPHKRLNLKMPHSQMPKNEKLPYGHLSNLVFKITESLKTDNIISTTEEAKFDELFETNMKPNCKNVDFIDENFMSTTLKLVTSIIAGCNLLHRAALDTSDRRNCSGAPFLEAFGAYLETAILESSHQWNIGILGSKVSEKMISVVTNLRQTSVGAIAYLEALLLQNGIHVDNKLRKTALFRMILNLVGTHCQKTQDFFSFKKELEGSGNEWRSNEACMLHKFKGFSEYEAMEKMIKDANDVLEQFEIIYPLFVNMWNQVAEKEQAEKFIEQAKRTMTIYVQGSAVVGRYHKNLTMDCYVDL